MLIPLPFSLKMPSQDHSARGVVSWSTFRVHGLLHFDGEELLLEWAVTAATDEVEDLDVRSEVVPLPAEALRVPLERVRTARLRGWWRPRLELTGNDLTVFFGVPGEDRGLLRLILARRDRVHAARLVDAMRESARRRLIDPTASNPYPAPIPPPEGTP